MDILAIDPSLRSLGYAFMDREGVRVGVIKPSDDLRGAARLEVHRYAVERLLDVAEPTFIVYEGYAMSRRANMAFSVGELGGVLKLLFHSRKLPVLIVPPTSLKMFATGKGNADKDQMRVAMGKHRGKFFKSDDEADAYALLQFGRAFLEPRLRPRDRRHYIHRALAGSELT